MVSLTFRGKMVEWVKLYVDVIGNNKGKKIRRETNDTTFLLWFYFISIAGKSNRNGALYQTENIPYTAKEIGLDYNFKDKQVQLAIDTFIKFEMIFIENEIIFIKNWEEYQNIDGLERIRKQGRERIAKYRANHQNSEVEREKNKEMIESIYKKK